MKLSERGAQLLFLCRDVLGHYGITEQPHYEILNLLGKGLDHLHSGSKTQMQIMILVPRGTYKTSIASAIPLAVLAAFPNARILQDTHTHDFTKQQLARIKFNIEHNNIFKEKYGDWHNPPSAKWAEDSIIINRRSVALQEGSIDTAAVDKPRTGGHYEVIIADDLQSEKNYASALGRQKVKDHIENLMPILQPGGLFIVLGTRWHVNDAYGHLIKQDSELEKAKMKPEWHKLIRSCFLPDQTLYAPSILTYDFLARMKRKMTPKKFAANYLNQPIAQQDKVFDTTRLKYFAGDYHFDYTPYVEARVEELDPELVA